MSQKSLTSLKARLYIPFMYPGISVSEQVQYPNNSDTKTPVYVFSIPKYILKNFH